MVALLKNENVDRFGLSACIPDTPGNSGVVILEVENPSTDDSSPIACVSKGFQSFGGGKTPTFMDSGASDTMFVSKDAFIEYKTTPPRTGDSAKAINGDFEIVGDGKVIQRYLVD